MNSIPLLDRIAAGQPILAEQNVEDGTGMDNFVHLEVQSAFSFLWGTFTPEALVEETVALGQKAIALTDDNVHGTIRFYKAAIKAGIQPTIVLHFLDE
jgi:DNA polymerase III alpha subunit